MTSLLARGRSLYAKIRDINGKWKRVRTGFFVGQEKAGPTAADPAAIENLRARIRELRNPTQSEEETR